MCYHDLNNCFWKTGADFHQCRLVVTSRTYAYQKQDWRLKEFDMAVLAPFTQLSERKRWVEACLRLSQHHVILNTSIKGRARELEKQGVKPVDALHVACAETAAVDYFLTCDDNLTKRYKDGKMIVCNPVEFVLNITREENHEHHS